MVTLAAPHPISALPPRLFIPRLALKLFRGEPAISRLESPLPPPHPRIFQHTWVRASSACYRTFTLDRVDHTVSGLRPLSRPIQTRFRAATASRLNLAWERNSPVHSTKARHHPRSGSDSCKHTVSGSISLPFRCFSPFPHGTVSLSVARVFSLSRWSCWIHTGFTCPALLGIRLGGNILSATGLLPLIAGLSRPLRLICSFVTPCETSTTPESKLSGLGCSAFARRY